MSFWLQEPSYVMVLNTVPRLWRIVITSSVCLMLFGGWGILFYYPLLQQKKILAVGFNELQKQQQLFYQKLVQEPKEHQQHDFLLQQLNALRGCQDVSSRGMLDLLMTQFKKHDLVCKLLHPKGSKKTCLFDKQYIYFEIKGPFKQVKSFLHDLGVCGAFVKYKKIALIRWKNNMIKGHVLLRIAYPQTLTHILSQLKEKNTFKG